MKTLLILLYCLIWGAAPAPEGIQQQLSAIRGDPVLAASGQDANRFYAVAQYQPAWLRGDAPTPQALAIIAELKDAAAKGLRPEDYDAANWDWRVGNLRREGEAASFDTALTLCVLRYASDLRTGRIHQRGEGGLEQPAFDLPAWVRERLVNAPDVRSALANLEPPFPGYRRTQRMLAIYRQLAEAGDNIVLPLATRPVKLGESYAPSAQLARILMRTGDLTARERLTERLYSTALQDAVKRFQTRHGLEPDGVLGKATVAELNTPLRQRVLQLELTLERWRSLPRKFARPPIVVNIPAFTLHALDAQNRTELTMRVVVGKAWGHQTPVFHAEMKYLIFQPYWDVPPSIAEKELLPKLAENPAFFEKNHYEFVPQAHGAPRIRQAPGKDNALGGVKFIFPNPHDVYLHGTPAVELFRRSRRDFSHGCIRVEKPEELAAWVLRDKLEWSGDRIHQAISGDGPRAYKPLQVNLTTPVPVLIVYGTAVVTENDEAHFYSDIYGLDALLEKALDDRPRFTFPNKGLSSVANVCPHPHPW